MKRPRLLSLVGCALVTAALLAMAALGGPGEQRTAFIVLYATAGVGFLLLLWGRAGVPLRVALAAAVVVRLAFLPGVPGLSDDHLRYLWDGQVQLSGINPYRYAPLDRRLDRVAYADRSRIFHPDLRTPYPPLAQAAFLGAAASGSDVLTLKLLLGAADLLAAAAVWWLAAAARRRTALVLYLLCPFVVMETWHAAHVDVLAALLTLVAAGLVARRRDTAGGLALGLAVATKLTPLVLLLPALVSGRARPGRLLLGFVPAIAAAYLPYLLTGGATGSLFDAGLRWGGGSAGFALLTRVMEPAAARSAAAALFLAGATWLALRFTDRERTAAVWAWTWTLAVLLLPVIHPWYWLGPTALGLAAGVYTPVLLGLAAPLRYPLTPRSVPLHRVWSTLTYAPALVAMPELRRALRAARRRPEVPPSGVPCSAMDQSTEDSRARESPAGRASATRADAE